MNKVVMAVVMAAGVCAAFLAGRLSATGAGSAEADEQAVEAAQPGDGSDELAKAKRRIAQLERRLEAAEAASLRHDAEDAKEDSAGDGQGQRVVLNAGDGTDILDALRKNLSEEDFEKATNAMGRVRAKMAAKAQDRIAFLKAIDTAAMTDEERANHEKFLELTERREAVRSRITGFLPDQNTIQELMEIEMQSMALARKERDALAGELARELGYAGEDADVVRDAVKNIYNCTGGGGFDGVMDAVGGEDGMDVKFGVQTHVVSP